MRISKTDSIAAQIQSVVEQSQPAQHLRGVVQHRVKLALELCSHLRVRHLLMMELEE